MKTEATNIMTIVSNAMRSAGWKFLKTGPDGPVIATFGLETFGDTILEITHQPLTETLVVAATNVVIIDEETPNPQKVLETLLKVNHRTALARFEMDPIDSEVRLAAAIPIMSGTPVTETQVLKAIRSVLDTLEASHFDIQKALGMDDAPQGDGQGATLEKPVSKDDLDSALELLLSGNDSPVPAAPVPVRVQVNQKAANDPTEMPKIFRDLVSFHSLTHFNEDEFLRLLEGSLSLSIPEKKRVIDSVPILSQFQIDELIKVFADEVGEFEKLLPREGQTIAKLKKDKAMEWQRLASDYATELASRLASTDLADLFTMLLNEPAKDSQASAQSHQPTPVA